MATFYLVVHLMMAVTQTARTKYIALQKFLLNGFLKPEELEKQNLTAAASGAAPGLTEIATRGLRALRGRA